MIRSVQINNFQAHKDTFIDFDEGVSAIIGISDCGKTSILRALTWCITNKPSGDAFQSSWGGDTSVMVILSSGDMITRGRDKKGNYYKVNEIEFRAFGAGDPPQEVQTLFNMNNINMSAQMDAPFLLSSSPGEVAQILNKVVNLDVIDTATSNIRKKKLEVDRELSAAQIQGGQLEIQIKEFAYLEELEKDVKDLESLQNQQTGVHAHWVRLVALIAQFRLIIKEQDGYQVLLPAEIPLIKTLSLLQEKEKISIECNTLLSLYNQSNKLQKEIIINSRILDAEKIVISTLPLFQEYQDQHRKLISLWDVFQDIRKIKTRQEAECLFLDDLEKQFHKEMPEECPLCGQEVKQ